MQWGATEEELKQLKEQEEEIGDLQIEVQKLKKFIEAAGERVIICANLWNYVLRPQK